WPLAQAEPTRYWLSTLAEDTPLPELVRIAHLRWRIERDYQDLKQDLGLGHYEGRGWRGFHHHAAPAVGQRAQRHVADSITTLRHQLGVYLMLEYCRDLYGGLGYPRL
ncbi:Transposase DDE domain-containing protein, partial [Azotobacter beijerinckii]